jgi:hypothetical protein
MDWNIPKIDDFIGKDPEKLMEFFGTLSEEQMNTFVRQAYIQAKKTLPEGPEKVLVLKLGRLCIQAGQLRRKYESATDEEDKKKIGDDLEKNVKEAMTFFAKIAALRQAKEIELETVEIKETESEDDPWAMDWVAKSVTPSNEDSDTGG